MNQPQKNTHGGQREGAGRPSAKYPQRIIKIQCTDEEYKSIIENTTPQERTKILLKYVQQA